METVLTVFLYLIILGSACFIGFLLWRKKAEGEWAYMAFVILIGLLTLMILVDTNKLSKFRLTMAGKDYRLSNVEVEEVFKTNISNILKVYHEYLVVEVFDLSSQSDKWKVEVSSGRVTTFLRLKYEPLEKTVSIAATNGATFLLEGNSFKNGYYAIPYLEPKMTKEELLHDYSQSKTKWEVRYIKKP